MIPALRALAHRVLSVFGLRQRDRELAEELESHIAFATEDHIRRGLDPVEARRQAALRFGAMEVVKENYRDRRGVPFIQTTGQDLRYASRIFRRSPGFTLVAVLTLALGIGVTTSVFSIVDVVWLKTLPVREPENLVSLNGVSRNGERRNSSYPLFRLLRDNEPTLAGVYATLDGFLRLPVAGHQPGAAPAEARVQLVSGEYFQVLGISAFGGRLLTPDDNRVPGSSTVAVVSHDFWRGRLLADPAAIGSHIRINGELFLLIGVAPQGFFGDAVGRTLDVWVPLMMQPTLDGPTSLLESGNVGWLRIMARVRDGRSAQQVRESIPRTLARLNDRTTFEVLDARRGLPEFEERFTPALRILAAVVLVVLLVACTNLATLLLARAESRQREMAVRLAIGAGRRRLVRQLLTEGVVLASLGCALGVWFAWWGARLLLVQLSSDGAPVVVDVTPNVRILAFAVGVASVSVLIFALAPALLALRNLAIAPLAGQAKRHASRLAPVLVGTQIALSLVVINGAALFVRTLQNLRAFDLGFAHESMLQMEIDREASGLSLAQVPDVSRRILERLSQLPGVEAATVAHSGFATGSSRTCCIVVEGHAHYKGEEREVATIGVAPGYFGAMALRLLQGRDFLLNESTSDPRQFPRVVVVNEAFVRHYLDNGNPIGRRLGWGDDPGNATYSFEIVGVAKDVTYDDLRQRVRPLMYFPSVAGTLFSIRLTQANEALVPAVRREVRAVDAKLEIAAMGTVVDDLERMLVRERMLATLSSVLGIAGILLAAIGVYGLAAHTVAGRTREIGVRMALGASRQRVRQSEIWSAVRLAGLGVAVGIPVALGAGQLIRTAMFGVSTSDPLTLSATSALLIAVAAAASFVPARRASIVDPMIALRSD